MRGKIKKTVVRVVDRAYGLHPDDAMFSSGSDAKALYAEKKRYISEKIESLLGPRSPYLARAGDRGDTYSVFIDSFCQLTLIFLGVSRWRPMGERGHR